MEQYTHHWQRQTNYKLDKFDLLSIDQMQDTVADAHEENLELAGTDAIWLSRKTKGIRCRCWDQESKQTKHYKCSLCYGVGWVGGYEEPVELKVSFTPGKHQINIENLGIIVGIQPSIWTKVTSPPIKAFDIIILKNDVFGSVEGNMRYYVKNSEESIIADGTRYQDVVLTFPDSDNDVIWDIPVQGTSGGFYYDLSCAINVGPIFNDLTCSIRLRNPWWNPGE